MNDKINKPECFDLIKIECAVGWYGVNCSRPCYRHCRDSSACNHVTGQCELGCDAGWTGSLCEEGTIKTNVVS